MTKDTFFDLLTEEVKTYKDLSSDLFYAIAAKVEEQELRDKLNLFGGRFLFEEDEEIEESKFYRSGIAHNSNCPILSANCFENVIDVEVHYVYLNDNDGIEMVGIDITSGHNEDYIFTSHDFCKGEISKITEAIYE